MEALDDLCPDCGLGDVLDEALNDLVVDVGLEEGLAYVSHCIGDVGLCDSAPARQGAEDVVEFFC